MKTFSRFYANYTIGADAYENVAKVTAPYGNKILVIGGEKALASAIDKVLKALESSGMTVVETITHKGECSYSIIDEYKKIVEATKPDMIFGFGGGKALDSAKGVADKCNLPIFAFPTIASTCAATSALSVVYKENGDFEAIYSFDKPAIHSFINLDVIAHAPAKYLRAGIGDTIGKFFECHFAARGDELAHSSRMGREVSRLCYEPFTLYGEKGLKDCENHEVSNELLEVVLAIIVSTGMVSLLVDDHYNSAVAHATYYGLVILPDFEEHYLHGDVVAYGVLVQLAIDGDLEAMNELKTFLDSIGIITKLSDMNVKVHKEFLKDVLPAIINGPDMVKIPYKITEDMILEGMKVVDAL